MSSAFIKSTIDVRHCSFSFLAATALSRMGAMSTFCAGAGAADEELPVDGADAGADPAVPGLAGAALPLAGAPLPLAVVASALVPKIPLMIFPKILIALSQ